MELRQYAESILAARDLAGKLRPPPDGWTDRDPGPAERWPAPGRPPELAIVEAARVKVPRPAGMCDPRQRPRILHALANHELQAVELFAWALVAFPDAPPAFRRGLVALLADEQRHMQLYMDRIDACGARFGDWPVTGYFWHRIDRVRTPLQFVCAMGLTFENANLDFAADYAEAARAAGDTETADVLAAIHRDEIRHVRFGWTWLAKLKPAGQSMWDAYVANVEPPLGPARARGPRLDVDARRAAGFDDAFIARLAATAPRSPSGKPR
ncbi:MAG: DUF455 family protein [Deltaproteobacteria bacterium]|nr:MAG: DUF455 family protein [Deltaproteobacteria bacterium]